VQKTILLLAAVAFGFTSFAQKPSEGNILTEANFSLNEWNNEFTLPSLRVRYFLADDMVFRADLNVSGNSTTNNFLENADGTGGSGEQKITDSYLGLRVGIEKHFAGNDKFSPFMVGAIGIGFGSNNEEWTDYNGVRFNLIVYPILCYRCHTDCIRFNSSSEILFVVQIRSTLAPTEASCRPPWLACTPSSSLPS